VIPRQVLDDQGVIRLDDALRNVGGASFSANNAGRNDNFTIRGFTASSFQNGFLDDFFSTRIYRETAHIERIEVLKGPASVLFGRAQPSGIINLIPKRPLEKPYYNLTFTAGSYNLFRTTADPSNPLFSIQVGEQKSQGIEFDSTGEILPGWNVLATYAYSDARIARDNTFAVGNRLPVVPRHSGSFWSTYRFSPESALGGFGFGLGIFAVDERPGDLAGSFTLPGYVRTDAAIYYNRNNFRAAVNFKNLFDVRYFEGANSRTIVTPGQPFTVQGTIGLQF
jgi:outer membrane receptor protein involved in Fe transport